MVQRSVLAARNPCNEAGGKLYVCVEMCCTFEFFYVEIEGGGVEAFQGRRWWPFLFMSFARL
jgi:hypothetical protein